LGQLNAHVPIAKMTLAKWYEADRFSFYTPRHWLFIPIEQAHFVISSIGNTTKSAQDVSVVVTHRSEDRGWYQIVQNHESLRPQQFASTLAF